MCRDERPRNIYWAVGLVRGHLVVRGQVDVSEEVQISELWKVLTMKVWEGSPRRNASSAKQSRGQKVWSAIKSNTPEDSTDKDKHQEEIGQREAKKYLRESCYHRIKGSTANPLAALMWRWYLNNDILSYSYSQRLQEYADGTRIKASNLTYTWRVEMKQNRRM